MKLPLKILWLMNLQLMNRNDFYYFGKITKKFGYKGELIFTLDVDDASVYHDLKFVFIEIHRRLIPFFIEHISRRTEDTILVKLEDISTPEKAQEFIGRSLYLPVELLPDLKDDAFYYHEIIGYEVIDMDKGVLGVASEIIEHPHQHLIQIIKGKHEILIPLAAEIIRKIDKKQKKIWIDAPEGLTEINI